MPNNIDEKIKVADDISFDDSDIKIDNELDIDLASDDSDAGAINLDDIDIDDTSLLDLDSDINIENSDEINSEEVAFEDDLDKNNPDTSSDTDEIDLSADLEDITAYESEDMKADSSYEDKTSIDDDIEELDSELGIDDEIEIDEEIKIDSDLDTDIDLESENFGENNSKMLSGESFFLFFI